MRTPKLFMTGVLLSLAAPALVAQAAPAPAAVAPPRKPKAPRAPAPPHPPARPHAVAPAPPAPPAPPDVADVADVWTISTGEPRARLGTQVSAMTGELRTFFGAPQDAGLLVQHIEPGSAAEAAKVAVGDVLVEVDGQRIERVSDVREALADRSKGDAVDVVVVRKKKRKTLKATLTAANGPTAFTMPAMPELDFELPPEALRLLSPQAQRELERELERAREQLHEVERELRSIEGPGVAPTPPAPPPPPKKRGRARTR